jgi:hypothetical protein
MTGMIMVVPNFELVRNHSISFISGKTSLLAASYAGLDIHAAAQALSLDVVPINRAFLIAGRRHALSHGQNSIYIQERS